MKNIKNILIIGKTNSGKSTLANVLLNKNNNFEEVFKENPYSSNKPSEIKEIQAEKFEYEGIEYRVIDIGSTQLPTDKLLLKIMEAVYSDEGEINQIFFTSRGEFTEEEEKSFKLLKTVFGDDIVNYITIVRTEFVNFGEESDSAEDNKTLPNLTNNIIHVDNPPLTTSLERNRNKETREESRTKLLNHLKDNYQENYKLDSDKIADYIKKIERRLEENANDKNEGDGSSFFELVDQIIAYIKNKLTKKKNKSEQTNLQEQQQPNQEEVNQQTPRVEQLPKTPK
jgi:hypothetical protein